MNSQTLFTTTLTNFNKYKVGSVDRYNGQTNEISNCVTVPLLEFQFPNKTLRAQFKYDNV